VDKDALVILLSKIFVSDIGRREAGIFTSKEKFKIFLNVK
jgi:hypothetical protein